MREPLAPATRNLIGSMIERAAECWAAGDEHRAEGWLTGVLQNLGRAGPHRRGGSPMTGPGDGMPTELEDYAFVTPVESWSLHDAMPATGEPCLVLGFLVRGQWGGLQVTHALATDIAIELGRWLSACAGALDERDAQ